MRDSEAKEKTVDKTSFGYGQPFILFLPKVRNSGLRASKLHITRWGYLAYKKLIYEEALGVYPLIASLV